MTDAGRLETLKGCYTSVVHDVMRARGMKNFTMPTQLQPLQPDMTLTGPAWTVEGRLDEAADPHETLLAWTGLLSRAKPGHIWTAQPHNHVVAQMGELSAETLHRKGVLGCVLDGGLRDAGFILRLGFPCWRVFHTPRDVVGAWLPTGWEVPVTIGEVRIEPGDWLHGDRDGMVRIPAAIVDEVAAAAVEAMGTESRVRTAILDGVDPQEAYRRHGKF